MNRGSTQPYKQGYLARTKGLPMTTPKDMQGLSRVSWIQGWRDADEKIARAAKRESA